MGFQIQRLTDVIDPDILKYICMGYSQEEGIPLGIVELSQDPSDGLATLAEHPLGFCRHLRSFPKGLAQCQADCDCLVAETIRRNDPTPRWHACRSGMVMFQVPIVIGGRVVAVVTGGHGRMLEDAAEGANPYAVFEGLSEVGASLDELTLLANEGPHLAPDELEGVLDRLRRVSEMIARIGRERYESLLRESQEEFLDHVVMEFGKPHRSGAQLGDLLAGIFERLNRFTGADWSGLLVADSAKTDIITPPMAVSGDRCLLDEVRPLLDPEHEGRFYRSIRDEDRSLLEGLQKSLGIGEIACAFLQPMAFLDSSRGVLFWIQHQPEAGRIEDQTLFELEEGFLLELAERLKSGIDVYEADRRKDDFMAEMTHRLKAPMQSVLAKSGFLSMYCQRKYPGDERIPEICSEIAHEVNVLNDQTKNFTFITTMDKGEQEYRLTPAPLMGILADCVDRFYEVARQREVEIVAKLDASPGHRILIDAPKMEIVFNNLLDNAVKYSHSKKRIEVKGSFDWASNMCRITVSSFGLGIAEHEYELIFQRYYRARAMKDTRRYIPGTGIGLTVVREIIRGHGGTIRVDSHRGQGDTGLESREGEGYKTTFTIELPIR